MMRAKDGRPGNRGSFAIVKHRAFRMSGPSTEWPYGAPPPMPRPECDDEPDPTGAPPGREEGGDPAPGQEALPDHGDGESA